MIMALRDPSQMKLLRPKKRHKFHAQKVKLGDLIFDSKAEAARYVQLVMLVRSGDIRRLTVKPVYEVAIVSVDGAKCRTIKYIPDFEYEIRGKMVTEDVKGVLTRVYKQKRRLFKIKTGRDIQEIYLSKGKDVDALIAIGHQQMDGKGLTEMRVG